MKPVRHKQRRFWVATPILVAASGVSLSALHTGAPSSGALLINGSPSVPTGLYRRLNNQEPVPGSLVTLAPPDVAKPYLARLGMPAGTQLLKRVAAGGPAATACARGDRMSLSDRVLPVQARDRTGRRLPRWRGCRRLAPDELFLLGDTPSSFDSRYFGPVPRSAVTGVYKEVIRW